MTDKVMTMREVIVIAIEALPGSMDSTLIDFKSDDLRNHVVDFIKDFARNRGVIFEDADIVPEINTVIDEMKNIAVARTKTPK